MICASCGTHYEPPVSGAPYCPNNNCPLHQQLAGSLGLRQQADLAMKEATMWAQAEQDAVTHLEDVRAKRKAAQGDVIAKLEAAKQQAADELEAIDRAAADLS
jgi:hypothetical protein